MANKPRIVFADDDSATAVVYWSTATGDCSDARYCSHTNRWVLFLTPDLRISSGGRTLEEIVREIHAWRTFILPDLQADRRGSDDATRHYHAKRRQIYNEPDNKAYVEAYMHKWNSLARDDS